jgi:LysM repeat protein
MNNPNPFVPKGSLLEQQSQRRSRLKLAVFCVLAVSVTGLVAVLINGCKRDKPVDESSLTSQDTNTIAQDTNNFPPIESSNQAPVVLVPAAPTNTVQIPQVVPAVPETSGSEYTVAKGDSLAKIAKKNGVTLKALEAANPGVVPTKLKIGQKLVLPGGGATSADSTAPAAVGTEMSTASYTVKSGDTLSKIAKRNGTTVKALEAENGLSTTKIKVGQKLKIPSKVEVAAPAAVAPVVDTAPALPSAPTSTTSAPAPGQ